MKYVLDKFHLPIIPGPHFAFNQAFRRFDVDQNGFIEYHELVATLNSLDMNMTEPQIYELMAGLDKDRDSKIDPRYKCCGCKSIRLKD